MIQIIITSLLVFLPALNGEFLFDDPAIPDMVGPRGFWARKAEHSMTFRAELRHFLYEPRALTHYLYRWTWQLAGLRLWAWHGLNFVFHAANMALVYAALLPILGGHRALLGAWLFGVHPLQVPSVCYVSGRAGLQATFFTLCGLVLFQQGHYGLMILSELCAWKSKQDAPVYAMLFPVYWYFLN